MSAKEKVESEQPPVVGLSRSGLNRVAGILAVLVFLFVALVALIVAVTFRGPQQPRPTEWAGWLAVAAPYLGVAVLTVGVTLAARRIVQLARVGLGAGSGDATVAERWSTVSPVGFIVMLVILAGLVLLLTVTAPRPANQLAGWSGWFGAAVPYVVVAVLGMIVALAELGSTFPNYPLEAIASLWGLTLIGINSGVAAVTYAIAHYYAPTADTFLLVLAVGVGFQSIIRTRFVLAREFGDGEGKDLSLNLGWLYEQFQTLCKTQIDMALMRNRDYSIQRLTNLYDEHALWKMAYYTILARTLTPEQEQERVRQLGEIPKGLPAEVVANALALNILETGGPDFAELLSRAGRSEARAASEADTRELLNKLVQLDVDLLARWALEAAERGGHDLDRLKAWVEGTKKSKAGNPRLALAQSILHWGGAVFAAEKLRPVEGHAEDVTSQPSGPAPAAPGVGG